MKSLSEALDADLREGFSLALPEAEDAAEVGAEVGSAGVEAGVEGGGVYALEAGALEAGAFGAAAKELFEGGRRRLSGRDMSGSAAEDGAFGVEGPRGSGGGF